MTTISKNFTNTGNFKASGKFNLKRIRRIILVPKYGSTNALNTIASTAGVTKSALQTLFIAADKKNRYYPLPNFKNLELTASENKNFEWDDGEKEFLREGVYTLKGYIKADDFGGPEIAEKLMAGWNGQTFGFFAIDEDNNFAYYIADDNVTVKPIPIAGGSLYAKYLPANGADDVGKTEIGFDFNAAFKSGKLRYISKENLDFDGTDYADVYGLADVDGVITSPSTTGLTVTLKTDYELPITGLAKDDMYLYNTTDSAEVTIASATESTTVPGQYVLTFTAQTASDGLRFNLLSASKYDPADTCTTTVPS